MRPSPTVLVLATAALALSACGTQRSGAMPGPTPHRAAPAGALVRVTGVDAGAATLPVGPVVRSGRFAVGDSVMLGSKPLLAKVGFRVDATVSRQFGSAVSVVRRSASAGMLPRTLVVHLGTNGTITTKDCRALVTAAGPARRVFFLNVRVPRSWTPGNNRTLRACDASFAPDRVTIIDWASAAAAHPGWVGSDKIHPSGSGRKAYTALIDSTLKELGL